MNRFQNDTGCFQTGIACNLGEPALFSDAGITGGRQRTLGFAVVWAPIPYLRLTANYGLMGGFPLPIDPGKTSIYLDQPAFAWR